MHNTSKVADEPYPYLLSEKGGTGFPSLFFLDEKGDVLLKQRPRTVDAFVASATKLDDWKTLKAKFEGGDERVAAKLLVAELELNRLSYPAALARQANLEKTDRKTAAQLRDLLIDAEARHILTDESNAETAGERLSAMMTAKRIPRAPLTVNFYGNIFEHAIGQKDRKLFQRALTDLKRRFGREQQMRALIRASEKDLKDRALWRK